MPGRVPVNASLRAFHRRRMEKALKAIADAHKLHPDAIKGPSRRAEVVGARRRFVRDCWHMGISTTEIAGFLNRDPSTIRRTPT
jgi:hypothetical protein